MKIYTSPSFPYKETQILLHTTKLCQIYKFLPFSVSPMTDNLLTYPFFLLFCICCSFLKCVLYLRLYLEDGMGDKKEMVNVCVSQLWVQGLSWVCYLRL